MTERQLAGVLAPITTPFDSATGEVAPVHLRHNVTRLVAAGLGGVVVAGLQELVAQGRIRRDETVVICITGSGLKTTELFGVRDGHRLQLGKARASDFVRALAEVENAPAVLA